MSDTAMSLEDFICVDPGQKHASDGLQDAGCSEDACDRGDWALLGESAAVRQLRSQIQRIAPYYRTALIRGEAGSGRKAVARAIHALSPAANATFVAIDASALTDALDFGEANADYRSPVVEAIEAARGGTLYVSDVGELSFRRQATLYRFVRGAEERRGSSIASMRILAESDRDLRTLASIGQFRQDLHANLSAVEISVPALRHRTEDIPMLAAFLLHRIAHRDGEAAKTLAEPALFWLQRQNWPGNLRDLERVLSEAATRAEGGVIEQHHLMPLGEEDAVQAAAASPGGMDRLHDVVQRHVLDVLTRCGGNKLRAAEALGISRSTLYRMLEANSACIGSTVEPRWR
jgi:DNA-binding NtrC family response regulator